MSKMTIAAVAATAAMAATTAQASTLLATWNEGFYTASWEQPSRPTPAYVNSGLSTEVDVTDFEDDFAGYIGNFFTV